MIKQFINEVCTCVVWIIHWWYTFNVDWFFFVFNVAEFVISLAEKNDTFEKYKKVLDENGAEFSVSKFQYWFIFRPGHFYLQI